MKKHIKNFSKFTLIGAIWSLLNIFLMWLVLDIIGMPTLIGSTLVVSFIFITRFYAYIFIGLIHPKFIRYAAANISFPILNIVIVWLLIDILKIPTLISSVIAVGSLFIAKFIIFNIIGLIK